MTGDSQSVSLVLRAAESPDGTPIMLDRLEVIDWEQVLVFTGTAGDQPFRLRYSDCREMRWRVYVGDSAASTPLASFAPGRDQQRSPAQFLTAHFGLSLYYGSVNIHLTLDPG
ncbi:MAG: hypothetical protein ABI700_22675 [Chloroflexota bacterium]